MTPDYLLVAIPPADRLDLAGLVTVSEKAATGGATSLQLRMKNAPADTVLRAARAVRDAIPIPVYINDRADIARAAGVHGVHFGADDFRLDLARRAVPRPLRMGISVGDANEADRAQLADPDFWSIGPFFPTRSKSDAGEALGAAGFQHVGSLAPAGMPRIAIGGITRANAHEAIAAGANGVAVISSVFDAADVERATAALRDVLSANVP